MTPKEKAIELVDKYWGDSDLMIGFINSKRCSLIAVDEIINELSDVAFCHDICLDNEISYYQQVKTEIEKL